jgi:hypothetical protein
VYVDADNSFTINGETCDLVRKPDIVVKVEDGQPIIEDCNSGKCKAAP